MAIVSPTLVIRLKTLTPLWLGDIDKDSNAVKVSGLIGSLRFWYEGILRGYGLKACDPSIGACGECMACRLFGSTECARRFHLEIEGLQPVPVFFQASADARTPAMRWLRTIFARTDATVAAPPLAVKALWSPRQLSLRIRARVPNPRDVLEMLALTVSEAARKGGIGAKTQNGFGQVRLLPDNRVEDFARAARERLERMRKSSPSQGQCDLFSLDPGRFFSLLYRIPEPPAGTFLDIDAPPGKYSSSYIPCSFDIHYFKRQDQRGLRPSIEFNLDRQKARNAFGFSNGDKSRASRIHVSHLVRDATSNSYLLKIWGDPEDKDKMVEQINQFIQRRFPNCEPIEENP